MQLVAEGPTHLKVAGAWPVLGFVSNLLHSVQPKANILASHA